MADRRVIAFRILGPFEVIADGRRVPITAAKERALLAILLLRRGEVVTAERLVEELWDGDPPRTAAKSLTVYVSHLRRAIGEERLVTRDGGYTLRVDDVDADRFTALCSAARRAAADGDAAEARQLFSEAVALWRGPPLLDFTYAAFAQPEIARLEEERAAAVEDRIDAELALGRHREVVSELERLVRQEPFRDRLRAQLMLALYRSGRQKDALAQFQAARRHLADELGLQPPPELQELERKILNHDPDLAAPPRPALLTRALPSGRSRIAVAAAAAGALLAAAAVVVAATSRQPDVRLAKVRANSLVALDAETGNVRAVIPVGAAPADVAATADAVWVANAGDRTLFRVDPEEHRVVASVPLEETPFRIATAGGDVWVAQPFGGIGTVARVDARSNRVRETVTVREGDEGDLYAPLSPTVIATDGARVWVNRVREGLTSITRKGLRTNSLAPRHSIDGIAAAGGKLWITSSARDAVLVVDPRSRRLIESIDVGRAAGRRDAAPGAVAFGHGRVWVANSLANTVAVIAPASGKIVTTIRVGRRPAALAVDADGAWVLNAADGTVSELKPDATRVVRTIPISEDATSIAAAGGAVWVAVAGHERAAPAAETEVTPIEGRSCGRLFRGGRPALLVIADLPLGGDLEIGRQMNRAIRRVFERRRFRAGPFPIAYQACDGATWREGAAGGDEICAENARAYAGNAAVIGVIAPYRSPCTRVQLAALNTAPEGPIPVISATNTYPGLTQTGPATPSDEPWLYFPTGVRNYVRLVGPDDRQGSALALLARELGARRLAVLHSGQGSSYAVAQYVALAARRMGVEVADIVAWDPDAASYESVARGIARLRPDAVVAAGCICENGLRLIADLRAALGRRVPLVASDAFTTDDNRSLLPVAEGVRIVIAGAPRERIPARGASFLRDVFGTAPLDWTLDWPVLYAADAAETLLDAVARSNGTRDVVLEELFATRRLGLTGEVAFDRNGDPVRAPFTVLRVTARARGGGVVERVVHVTGPP